MHMQKSFFLMLCGGVAVFLAGCQTKETQPTASSQPAAVATAPTTPAQPAAVAVAPSAPAQPAAAAPVVPAYGKTFRFKAGSATAFKDSSGNVWLPDQGFDGGDTVERPDTAIANTKDPGLYQSEHYGMSSFSYKVPNGKYTAKLHFAETFEGISGPGDRVFSFNCQGHEFKNFDVFAKAGGAARAYIESVPVEVTNGVFKIDFTPNVENPQINAIELIPAS
jgi:hypothetical protein